MEGGKGGVEKSGDVVSQLQIDLLEGLGRECNICSIEKLKKTIFRIFISCLFFQLSDERD